MYNDGCGCAAGSDGLGFWSALVPIGANLVSSAISGPELSIDQWVADARQGIFHCPVDFDVAQVAQAYDQLERASGTEASSLRSEFSRMIDADAGTWTKRGGLPSSPLEMAGAAIAYSAGGQDCSPIAAESAWGSHVARVLSWEARNRSLLAQASDIAHGATRGAGDLLSAEVMPGISTPLLVLAGLGLGWAFLRR